MALTRGKCSLGNSACSRHIGVAAESSLESYVMC